MKRILWHVLAASLLAFAGVATSQEGYFPTYDPLVEMTVFKSSDNFFGYNEEQRPGDNDMYSLVRDVVGVQFVNKAEPASAAWEQVIRLSIASNDIPDMIASTAEDFATMIENDMLVDLAPFIEEYMSDALKKATNEFGGSMYAPVSRGEAVYAIPSPGNIQGQLRAVWIRQDWLDNLGRDAPTTMEELLDLARAFAHDDPDANGEDDTFGIAVAQDLFGLVNPFEVIANAYGYYPNRTVFDGEGNITYGSLDPGLKDILTIFQDFYREGVIDPEFATKNFQQVDEDIAAGKIGLMIGVFWKPVDPGMASTYQDGVDWTVVPVPPSETMGEYHPFVTTPVTVYYGIRNGYDHPEALIGVLNHLYTTSTDPTAEFALGWREVSNKHMGVATNNWLPVLLQNPVQFECSPLQRALADPDFNPDNPQYVVHQQAYDILRPDTSADDVTQVQFNDIFLGAVCAHESYDIENYVTDAYFGVPTPTQRQRGSILNDREEEIFTTIVADRRPVSDFDGFIEEYRRLGGDDIIEEMNEIARQNQ